MGFKKASKRYVLSDSSVNEYGFRLLTSGYVLDAFQKNPIGYYMHRREDGVALKWEDLAIQDDQLCGTPVINLSNARGQQMCDEVENGFLNAASVGHIVVLEYSTDKDMMLPGQTGPTITKWYNKECSLVDIPGNCNALTQLYDASDNVIQLADISNGTGALTTDTLKAINNMEIKLSAQSQTALNLSGTYDSAAVDLAIAALALKATNAETELNNLKVANLKAEVDRLLNDALTAKKVTVELKNKLASDYDGKPDLLKALLASMPAYASISDRIEQEEKKIPAGELAWTWDDYQTKDPDGVKLAALKANNPTRFQEISDAKFKK